MLRDAPSCPEFTNAAPLPAAPSTASRLTTEVTTKNPVRASHGPDHQGDRAEQQQQAQPGVHGQRGRPVRQGPAGRREHPAALITGGHGDVQAHHQPQGVLDQQPGREPEAGPADGLVPAGPGPALRARGGGDS